MLQSFSRVSWTGNLVTSKTWEHFWLNEGQSRITRRRTRRPARTLIFPRCLPVTPGFTVYCERKILGRLEGEATRQMEHISGIDWHSDFDRHRTLPLRCTCSVHCLYTGLKDLADSIEVFGAENPLTAL
jgi:leukotriene-A4 hydrolase